MKKIYTDVRYFFLDLGRRIKNLWRWFPIIWNDKDYDDHYFDNFKDLDKMFGHRKSLFGTRGLDVGDEKRTSRSFNQYNERYGPVIVRVVKDKKEKLNEVRVPRSERVELYKDDNIKFYLNN